MTHNGFALIFHPVADVRQRLAAAVPAPCACSEGALDPAWPRAAVAILHTRLAAWRELVAQLRRAHPGIRLAVVAETVEAASAAVTELHVTHLLHRDDDVPAMVAKLRAAPPTPERWPEERARLACAGKTSAVGRLAGPIAHQLNSPLTSILVFAEALLHKTAAEGELHQHAAEIVEAAQRCRVLLHGLLRFARRPRAAPPDGVPLAAVIADLLPLLQHRLDLAAITVAVELPDDLPAVAAPRSDLEQVLVELLTNAIDASPPGATVRLAARQLAPPGRLELVVADEGRGMTPALLQAAFDPFFSTQPAGQAAGLGLPTCEAIVAAFGGTLALASAPQQGTSVRVGLPAVRALAADGAGDTDA